MNYRVSILALVIFSLFASCKQDWDQHYNDPPVTSDVNVWDAMQKDPAISTFVQYLKDNKYDTLFLGNSTYTMFAPTNEAFTTFLQNNTVNTGVLAYHVSKFFIQTPAILGKRKVQTFMEKYALFNNDDGHLFFDEIPIEFESPLYKNGKYYRMGTVALPKPNLYEYIALTNPVLKRFIDSEDSVILNKQLSTPIGFDENGNTIYDTVADIINMFEVEFFPISEEYRNLTATLVFPKEANYNAALDSMAQNLHAGYTDHNDIPIVWQNKVLIPYLLERGVFENMLEREEFIQKAINDTVKLKNILGDSVVIDYEPGEKTICSNGYAYNYDSFIVPDTLYQSPTYYEGEWWLKTLGNQSFAWNRGIENESDKPFEVRKEFVSSANNDTIFRVYFNNGYTGKYSIEFNVNNLFPRKYLAVFRTVMRVGGVFDIYVNDQLVKTFDYAAYKVFNGVINSVVPNKRYVPEALGYNRFDFWINNLQEYGKAKIRIEYKGPSTLSINGLVLDYIQFVPYD
ncbi:MAG TPA: fasciclin domain-containing protein [Bacteroidales bacterium]|nr:fasciclin domain-containing protein [Bacteroidales bacterium]